VPLSPHPLTTTCTPHTHTQMGAGPDIALEVASAAPRRSLFHHTPYTQQEPLANLAAADVAAVLEVMVGRAGGSAAPSVISGLMEEDQAIEAHWRPEAPPAAPAVASQPGGRGAGGLAGASSSGGAPRPPKESLGQMCACILSKMVIDTWLGAGPEASLPLVLRMLQQALHHPHPAIRARPFDILYNLAVHAALLSGCDDDAGGGADEDGLTPQRRAGYDAATTPPLAATGPGSLPPPSAPPELAGQLYARPQSPSGAQRPRGGSGQSVGQLHSPRIHLPPQVMAQQGAGSGAGSGGGTSPRSPLSSAPVAAGGAPNGGGGGPLSPVQQPTPQLQQGLASPRSRLGRGDGPSALQVLASPGGSSAVVGEGSEGRWAPAGGVLEMEFEGWLRQLLFELLTMLAQVSHAGLGGQSCGVLGGV